MAKPVKNLIASFTGGTYNPGDSYGPSSGYGPRVDPVSGVPGTPHRGNDFNAPVGTSVPAAQSGEVYFSGTLTGYGNTVIIKHTGGAPPLADDFVYYTLYAHLKSPSTLKAGDEIDQGDLLGLVGNTGKSTGSHLHFEVITDQGNPLLKGHAVVDPTGFPFPAPVTPSEPDPLVPPFVPTPPVVPTVPTAPVTDANAPTGHLYAVYDYHPYTGSIPDQYWVTIDLPDGYIDPSYLNEYHFGLTLNPETGVYTGGQSTFVGLQYTQPEGPAVDTAFNGVTYAYHWVDLGAAPLNYFIPDDLLV